MARNKIDRTVTIIQIIGVALTVVMIFAMKECFCGKAHAICYSYKVEKGDTFRSISDKFAGVSAGDIKHLNRVKRKYPMIDEQLIIYQPDGYDWDDACSSILYQRVEQLRVSVSNIPKIVEGIDLAAEILELTPSEKIEACRWAAATAQQESMFRFAIGSAGEVGMYQFKLDTVRLTYRWHGIEANISDSGIVRTLLDTDRATMIFLLHFHTLYERNKSLWLAWRRYNNGSDAAAYASRAIEKYRKVRKIIPEVCGCPSK